MKTILILFLCVTGALAGDSITKVLELPQSYTFLEITSSKITTNSPYHTRVPARLPELNKDLEESPVLYLPGMMVLSYGSRYTRLDGTAVTPKSLRDILVRLDDQNRKAFQGELNVSEFGSPLLVAWPTLNRGEAKKIFDLIEEMGVRRKLIFLAQSSLKK